MAEKRRATSFVVVGGGIAGVTCAETLGILTQNVADVNIMLISASALIKAVVNHQQFGHTMESMDIAEKASDTLAARFTNLTVRHSEVTEINSDEKTVLLSDNSLITYEKICIATGASPKKLSDNNHVLSIRDTESVKDFQQRLKNASRAVIVGNGGIATELVYEVQSCEMIWCIRHKSISAAFFDGSAAQFFLPHLQESHSETSHRIQKRWKYSTETGSDGDTFRGNALGPDWASMYPLSGASSTVAHSEKVKVQYEVEMHRVMTPQAFRDAGLPEATNSSNAWPVYIQLTNQLVYGADVIVNATGVVPACNITFSSGHKLMLASEDSGLLIDTEMRTSVPDVYAAGDIVSTTKWQQSAQWHQMRLWTQAKQMGCYTAKCMLNHWTDSPVEMDFCFELFSHVTQFFGFKVVLLGLYNAQGLDPADYVVHLRCTKGTEYVKVVVENNRLVGAILIGDTDLEETFENLILNRLDISHIEERLLDPDIDLEDYFD